MCLMIADSLVAPEDIGFQVRLVHTHCLSPSHLKLLDHCQIRPLYLLPDGYAITGPSYFIKSPFSRTPIFFLLINRKLFSVISSI